MVKGITKSEDMGAAKLRFILSTIVFIALSFFVGHVVLVNLYNLGRLPTIVMAVLLTIAIVLMFAWPQKHRFFPLVTGLLLWSVLGEITEHLGYGDIVSFKNVFLLISILIFVYSLVRKKLLSEFLTIVIVFFVTIWSFHFVLINVFEGLGRTHVITYASSLIFLIIMVFAILKALRSYNRLVLTLQVIFISCSAWAIVEYLWAWNLVPKPW
ncbi:MAG: hypothetical protein JSV97_12605 [candidate division WOR-3 bacterium]|nr:MAG: hypothetical protein JSV97_12605 [candidate division WOR-3 bacterium]